MSDHSITYDLQYSTRGTWKCEAPPEAFCHAVWDCGCEGIWNYQVVDGLPAHDSLPGDFDPDKETHVGHFDADQCSIQTFHDEGEEDVEGTIIVDVDPEWQGEWYLFKAVSARVDEGDEPDNHV